ncbi:MAG: AAA family ATPase [Desulfobacteraceae bacterium]|uniref:AAA family ATPase n=1 Tax=Candidatus Desulfaltia bathyphila TaxID=2841697 RepID=A0A8J6N5W7_9BACT|nr:AAA family ATPase [Candidatus Desulfaltia bathyphila]MBL7196409.1 AAA family ATPase [Desulfobacterales bacterium]
MTKKDVSLYNPLSFIGYETENIIPEGGFGAVLARAGVGKTAFLVQIAISALLQGKNVLHISLDNPVDKVSLWYKEVFSNLVKQCKTDRLWENILPHRFIMTFKVEGFSVPKLEERLTDLTEQNIFFPDMVVIDGLPFDESTRNSLPDLKALAKKHSMHVWFAVRIHRHEQQNTDGMPVPFSKVADLFDVAIQLKPEGREIHVRTLKGSAKAVEHPILLLDPSTMMIKKSSL